MQRTLIVVKPDGVQRRLVGQVIKRFEEKGLKLVAAKFMRISGELARSHYAVHKDKEFFEGAVKYLSCGPVLLMVWQGEGAIAATRRMMGATFGFDAEPGTIRGDFGCSRRYNLVHGSDSTESAEYEIGLYFDESEIIDYEIADAKWVWGEE